MGLNINMSEPVSGTAGGIAGYKLVLACLPVAVSLIAFWLGLRFVPVRKGREREDIIDRVMACVVSSFVVGIPALVLLMQHWPGAFTAGEQLALRATLQPVTGFFAVTGCVLLLSSIPGPWLVAAVFLWLERRKDKDIGQIIGDVRGAAGKVIGGADDPA